ncbi:MAG TPA: ABC transporter substrate-binding protein [Acidimicrobiales bacterium]|nr:ABC transporter substrate-binding protein [Acidimicrobiales bacterium]
MRAVRGRVRQVPTALAAVAALLGVWLTALAALGTVGAMAAPTAAPMAVAGGPAHSAYPTRILSLSPSATQMLYSIGAGHDVVGVDKYSTWPPYAPRTKFTGYETSAEDYLYLHPDLVVFAFQSNVVQQLKLLGVPSLVLPPATGLPGVYAQITELGALTGHRSGARHVNALLAAEVASDVRTADGGGRGESYYVELDPAYYYSATSKTFIGAEFSLFGMRDIADAASHGSAYPALSPEYVLKADPDYVFLADTVCCRQSPATFARRPGFSALRAVKLHHVIGVNDSVASQWGPHTIELFVHLVARTVRR